MAKIEVFRLDIDIDAAIKATSDLKKEADQLKAALSELKKTGDTNSAAYVEMDARLKSLNSQYGTSQREIGKLLNLQVKEITTVQQGRNALSVLNIEWAKQASLFGENSEEAQKLAGQKLKLTERLKELEKATGDNTRNVGNYTDGMKKALESTDLFGGKVTQVREFVGHFSGVFKTAWMEIKAGAAEMRNAAAGTEGMSKAQKAATITSNFLSGAMKILKVALISTGIGAIVVVLGSLVAYLSTTQKGIDMVTSVTRPLQAVFSTLVGVVQDVGEFLFNAFANPKKTIEEVYNFVKDQVMGVFKSYGKILEGIVNMDFGKIKEGFSDLGNQAKANFDIVAGAVDKVVDRMGQAIVRGQEVDAMMKQLANSEADFITKQGELTEELKQQNLIAEDQNKTLSERETAAKRTLDIAREINEGQRERLDLERKILEANSLNNDIGNEEKNEIAHKIAEVNASNAQMLELETTQQNKLNAIRKEANEKAKARQEELFQAAIKKQELELQLYIQGQGYKAKTLKEQLTLAETVFQKELAIEQKKLDKKKITQEEFNLFVLEKENELAEARAILAIDEADRQLKAYIDGNQSRLDQNEFLSQELYNQEQERLNELLRMQSEYEAQRLAQGVINQTQYNEAINEINNENREHLAELDEKRKEDLEEARLIDIENQRIIDGEKTEYDLAAAMAKFEQEYAIEKENAIKNGADMILFEQAQAKKKKDIEEAVKNNKIQLASETLGTLAGILGKESAAGKAVAVAQATIDTYSAAVAAYKAMSGIPIVGPFLGAAAAAAAAIAGAINIQKIVSVKEPSIPKAEKGALFKIGGRSHAQGGTKFRGEDGTVFEAERDELIGVMNKNAAASFMRYNNAFVGGGHKGRNYFATGGIIERSSSTSTNTITIQDPLNYEKLGQTMAEANMSLPNPVVAVEDINREQERLSKVVNGATF